MRTVLIITEVFPPCENMTSSSKRLTGFAKYLPEFGWAPIVLNLQCNCVQEKSLKNDQPWAESFFLNDKSDMKILKDKVSGWTRKFPLIIRVSPKMGRIRGLWQFVAALTGSRFRFDDHFGSFSRDQRVKKASIFLRYPLTPLRKMLSWMSNLTWDHTDWVNKGTKIANILCEALSIDVVLSTSPNLVNHVIAYRVTKKRHIRWAADLRDSIAIKHREFTRFPMSYRIRFLRKASCFVHVTPEEAERDRGILGGKKNFVIENGFLEEEIMDLKNVRPDVQNIFILRYLGVVDSFSQLDLFLTGFREFINKHSSKPLYIRFEYYGHSFEKVRELVKLFDLESYSAVNPNVSFKESISLMGSSTVLIQPIDARYPGCPGGKFYEYLGVQRPILATGTAEPYVESILANTGAGTAAHSPTEIAQVLGAWYAQFLQAGEISLKVNPDEIMKYSRRVSTRKLAEALSSLF